jgi:TonB-dependent starch-binding outer membrane protein SusC
MNRVILFLIFYFSAVNALESQITINGSVRDAITNEALIGAFVFSKENEGVGTSTDFDGNFELTVPNATKTLIFSYTGYENLETDIAGRDQINVVLRTSSQLLDDVIIIGYGTVKREDATGAVTSVSSELFNRGAITGPQQLLAGKVAGVAITTDGSPGGGAQIRIRGESSLNASNDPLIVIDGVPMDNSGPSGSRNPLNIINPNDIESFTILRDASAAAIYGNRASGGVIIITTKKGKLGQGLRVSYNANAGFGTRFGSIPVLTAEEFRNVINDPDYQFNQQAAPLLGDASTDWQSEIFRPAFTTDHNLAITGSTGIIPYRVSLGYTNQDGLLKTDNFNRLSTGINISPGFMDNRLQVNVGIKGMINQNQFADRGAVGSALSFDPTLPVRDPGNAFGGFTTVTQNNGNPEPLSPANPMALLELRDDRSTVRQYIANASVDYRFKSIPELRLNLNLAQEYSKGSGTIIVPNFAAFSFDPINGGGVDNWYENERKNSLLEFYSNYNKRFGKHNLDLMGGYSWQRFFENNSFRNSNTAGTAALTVEQRDIAKELFLLSVFSRINYSFDDRYLLTLSVRRDATSRFNPEFNYGLFPAAAFAVKLIDNDNAYFNNIKLRTGVGVTGQQDLGGNFYPALGVYERGLENAAYLFENDTIRTLRPNGYTLDLRWEETTTYNVGVDFSVIKDKLSATLDVYQRNTRDLLNFVPVPALSNLTNFANINIGEMTSKGIEFTLDYTPIRTSKMSWNIGANAAYNISEITRLTISDDPSYLGILTGGIAGGVGSTIQIHSVGNQPSSFFVLQQQYDENGTLLEGEFTDQNGDGIINELDRVRYRNPAPFYTLGITSNFSYGNFDFSFAGRANLGNWVYNNIQTDMGYLDRIYHPSNFLVNVHRSAVDLNVRRQGSLTFSDHFVQASSFFRFDHITMGYNIDNFIGRYFRVFATFQNPFVFTGYTGLDPEIGNGIDNNVYPRARNYLLGISVDF